MYFSIPASVTIHINCNMILNAVSQLHQFLPMPGSTGRFHSPHRVFFDPIIFDPCYPKRTSLHQQIPNMFCNICNVPRPEVS
ncbi:hypothetical protein LINPERHAP1_LOCUS30747 [Linum perenne]